MATTAESGSGDVLRSEHIAAGILPKVLNSFDMVAIFVAIVLFISNSAVMAGGAGPAAYIYWGLGFITFLIPGAIVTGQLGLMFPGEGSIYVWTNKAFGAFLGFFAGFCAWWPGVLVMIATGDAVVSLIQQLNRRHRLLLCIVHPTLPCYTKLRQHCLRSLRRRYSPHRPRRLALAWAPGSSRLLAARMGPQLGQRHLLWHRHPGSPRY